MKHIRAFKESVIGIDKKENCDLLIKTILDILIESYPNVSHDITEKDWSYKNAIEYKITIENIKEYPQLWTWRGRDWPDHINDWLKIDKNNWDLVVTFDTRTYDEIELDKFLISIMKKYQTNNNKNIIIFKYKDVQKIVDEITLENFNLYREVDKYNL